MRKTSSRLGVFVGAVSTLVAGLASGACKSSSGDASSPVDLTGAPPASPSSSSSGAPAGSAGGLAKINHFIVLYMENHSFDNLYGEFDAPDVEGRAKAGAGTQIDPARGAPLEALDGPAALVTTLPDPSDPTKKVPVDPNDPNAAKLTTVANGGGFPFPGDANQVANGPFAIEGIGWTSGSLTHLTPDLPHLFFLEQAQIDGGKMDGFGATCVAGGCPRGFTMGYWHTMSLPTPAIAKGFTVCDHFFHAAFGGSFLNHQWLIAARTPEWSSAVADHAAIVAAQHVNGTKPAPQLWTGAASGVTPDDPSNAGADDGVDQDLSKLVDDRAVFQDADGTYYVVNTSFSANAPHPSYATSFVPYQTYDTIGDRLSDAGVDWAWYSGGWNLALGASDASGAVPNGVVPDPANQLADIEFQYHHQPFNYFAKYKDGTAAKAAHLKDEADFVAALDGGTLPAVSFVKPVGIDNEHPGYADILTGDQKLADMIEKIQASKYWTQSEDVAIIVTYDEHGGSYDHVVPPARDKWGPGLRVPAIVISPWAKRGFIDHAPHDTTSILATIEKRFGLAPLTDADRNASTLESAFDFDAPAKP